MPKIRKFSRNSLYILVPATILGAGLAMGAMSAPNSFHNNYAMQPGIITQMGPSAPYIFGAVGAIAGAMLGNWCRQMRNRCK